MAKEIHGKARVKVDPTELLRAVEAAWAVYMYEPTAANYAVAKELTLSVDRTSDAVR